ncbi:ABC transporter substrate-binding protein [Streptomyces profundus]|uniref:ABC transporter substrate-binding protein n=1 Tax=Streptomyces profundus TaxID=2867410 RepID=UPI001D164A64|nr:ABC transporter substrate-binding protein [Streptomyces sp. MA3_2.13]UED86201.1 ABC transporter substrate-binding protein [Streptomyces sp. MA3_2.13]
MNSLIRFPRATAVAAGAAALGLLLTACSSDDDGEGDGATDNAAGGGELLASVETTFGTVDIPRPEDGELTVVALGWSDAEAALALGVTPVAVYDWLGFGEEQKGVGPWASELFGAETPEVIENVNQALNYEQIQSLEPDLILNTRSANDEEQYERLSSIAPTVSPPADTPAYATPWETQTRLVAEALGREEDGERLVTEVEERIAEAAAEHPEFEGVGAVTGSKFGEAYGASLPGDARFDLLAQLGFELHQPVAELPSSEGFYAPVATEQVEVLDAELAVLFPIGYTLDELLDDPLLQSLQVVRDDRAVFLDGEGEISQAFSAASVLSIPLALDGLLPQLASAVATD